MKPSDRLARLHFVNTVLDSLTGQDLFLAAQVLAGIEAAQDSADPSAEDLGEKLTALHERLLGSAPESGFAFCDGASDGGPGPLFVRAGLLSAVRRNAPRRRATIMVANLPGSTPPPRSGRGRTRAALEHASTVDQLRGAAARSANPRSLITLLFV